MDDSDFLRRIDAEVARTNAFLEEDRAARQRELAAHGDALQDVRFEMRQMSLRGERLAQGYLRALEDMSDQIRANTRALLVVLDELKQGGGPAAAGA